MRRTLLLLLALTLLPAAARAQGTPVEDARVVGFVTGSAGLGDLSYNDNIYAGLRRAQMRHGFRLVVVEPEKSGATTAGALEDLADTADVLVLAGAQHADLAVSSARAHPDKRYVLIETAVSGPDNLCSVHFAQNEGSFLAGAAAAMASSTHTVGFIGGSDIPPVHEFLAGYRAGARYVDPKAVVPVAYISPAGDFSGFGNPRRAYRLAEAMYQGGADVIFAVAGRAGNGVIEAARRTGNLAIGVDSDQDGTAKGYVLTSMLKRMDVAAERQMDALFEGRFTPGATRMGLAEGGVGLTTMPYTRQLLPEDGPARLSAIRKAIIAGDIAVPDSDSKPPGNTP